MNWQTLVSAAVGVALGATLQYWFGQRAEAKRHRREKRADAYAEFLKAIAAAARLRNDDDLAEALRAFAAAKARIVVYGSRPVVDAIAAFELAGAETGTAEGAATLIAVCRAMRGEQGAGDDVSDSVLRALLIGAGPGAGAARSEAAATPT
jgi:hypothetical protein